MKLKKLILKGYRSIKSEEQLLVDDRITILIGANDHGKTNLLWAIKSLNDDTPIIPDDRRWDLPETATIEIRWHFVATEPVLKKLRALSKKPRAPANPAPEAPAPVDAPTPEQTFALSDNQEIVFARESVSNKVRVVALPVEVPISAEANVLALRPEVELFAPPSTNVTDQVSLRQLENDPQFEFMQGMFRLAGLWEHRGTIFAQNPTTSKILDRASGTLTRILNDQWNQGKELKWKFKHTGTNGDHIVIEIEDPAIRGRYTRPSLRSSGFRTYFLLSMIIFARTQNKTANSNIYLFDEPGTYLHPSAQLDLQRSFETIADHTQIIYTTHSLFLVSKNYPQRNRVVSKNKAGNQNRSKAIY